MGLKSFSFNLYLSWLMNIAQAEEIPEFQWILSEKGVLADFTL